MTMPDEPFFREWDTRRPGARRSLDRARDLSGRAGLRSYREGGVLVVVGSKGKGTAAVYASAYLAAAGRRVITVTSPSLRDSTERIRVDGRAVTAETLAALGQRLAALIEPPGPGDGYLSPSGLFTLAGLLHARDAGADHVVLEAGRGGASDEVSLVAPAVVAITPIFAEHVAELGGSLAAVVEDKCGVVRTGTRTLVGPQPPPTKRLISAAVADRGGRVLEPDPDLVPAAALPPGLGRANALLGCAAAATLLPARPAPTTVEAVLGSITLPGRLSVHQVPGTATQVLIDTAVSRAGFATAMAYARTRLGGVDHVLLSLPDDKDLGGAMAQLAGSAVTFVPVTASHLRYTRPLPSGWRTLPADRLDRTVVASLGDRVVALGTVSFAGRLLAVLGAPTATAFRPPRPA
jgi:folylpolyglutamate synthase/dihydropteroate synthase